MRSRILPVLASFALAVGASAQSTAFTYQGLLKDGGVPAEGLHDFRFRLFDAASGGAQVGTTQCLDNIVVSGGVFTTTIDFGNQFVTSAQRFIEIEVRHDTGLDCSSAGGFAVLVPRQAISPAPTATHAKSAFSLDAANGSIANAVFVDNTGKVGIGTLAPTHSVHIANPAPTLALQDTDSTGLGGGQQVGYVSYRDSSNVERAWVGFGSAGDPDFSIVNARTGGDIILNAFGGGKVGIGTTAPAAALDVRGDVRLGGVGQFFAASGEENLRIVRGSVASNGSILAGTGFSVSHVTTGFYSITCTTPFSGPLTCTGVSANGPFFVTVNTPGSTSNVVVAPRNLSSGAVSDAEFSFIIVGPR